MAATNTSKKNYLLWTIQTLLALLFLFTGGVKLVLPIANLPSNVRGIDTEPKKGAMTRG